MLSKNLLSEFAGFKSNFIVVHRESSVRRDILPLVINVVDDRPPRGSRQPSKEADVATGLVSALRQPLARHCDGDKL